MLNGISKKLWFRWALVLVFLVAMFSLPLLPSPVPQQQTYPQSNYSPQKVEHPISPDERLADYTEALAVFTALLAVVSCFQVWLLIRADSATAKALAASTQQAEIAKRSSWHFRLTERAYIKMSHMPPGAQFTTDLGHQAVVVNVRIQNFGHTPGHIIDVYLDTLVLEENGVLPPVPVYPPIDGHQAVAGFLVAGDHFDHMASLGLTADQVRAINERNGRLIVLGYVDYRDKFDIIHRGAYAREYDEAMDDRMLYGTDAEWEKRNNLPMITEPRYNDDFMLP